MIKIYMTDAIKIIFIIIRICTAIMSEVPVSTNNGYIELYVFTDRGRVPIEDAVVTIYARQGEVNEIPVKRVLTKEIP